MSGITCYSCDTVSGFGDTCGDLATAATQTCPAATFCVAVAGEVRLPGLLAPVSARRLSCDQYVDWIGQGDQQKTWLGLCDRRKYYFVDPRASFCSLNGEGCHSYGSSTTVDGVTVENIQICCCDTDL